MSDLQRVTEMTKKRPPFVPWRPLGDFSSRVSGWAEKTLDLSGSGQGECHVRAQLTPSCTSRGKVRRATGKQTLESPALKQIDQQPPEDPPQGLADMMSWTPGGYRTHRRKGQVTALGSSSNISSAHF